MNIALKLCEECAREVMRFPQPADRFREFNGSVWLMLPPTLCPPCSAKIAQCVRLLVSGHVLTHAGTFRGQHKEMDGTDQHGGRP